MKLPSTFLAITLSSIVTASAHPGHPGHEDWPFDDFGWSMVAIAVSVVIVTGLLRARRRAKISR